MTTPTAPPKTDPLASLPRLDRHKPKCGPVRKSKSGRWRAGVLIGVHVLVGLHIVHWLSKGTTVTPVEPSEAGYLLDAGKLNAGFVLFLVLIAGTLVFGRWFCGWACHVVALQDLCAWLLGKVGLRPRPVRSRLLLFVPFLVAFEMFFRGPLERLLRGIAFPAVQTEFTTTALWERFPGPLMGVLTFVVVGFLVVWWLGAKGFCTYGCPYGAFFGVVDRFAPGRIKVTDACDACGHCTSVCTSNVRVHEEVAIHKQIVDPACMKCMDCVSVCPKDALYYGFAKPKPFRISQQRIRARADFTWPEEIAMAAVAIAATLAYRGAWFGEGVPLLMAVGLGVITAVFALLGWRLLRRADLAFQHTLLKVGGRFRPAGVGALVGIAAWVVLTADTGMVQFELWRATTMPIAGRDQPSERAADLRTMDGRLVFAQSVALVEDPRLACQRGLALRELAVAAADESGLDRAEQQLRRAIAVWPDMVDALVPLADLLNLRGEFGEAERLLRHALEVQPTDPRVRFRLDAIERRRPR